MVWNWKSTALREDRAGGDRGGERFGVECTYVTIILSSSMLEHKQSQVRSQKSRRDENQKIASS